MHGASESETDNSPGRDPARQTGQIVSIIHLRNQIDPESHHGQKQSTKRNPPSPSSPDRSKRQISSLVRHSKPTTTPIKRQDQTGLTQSEQDIESRYSQSISRIVLSRQGLVLGRLDLGRDLLSLLGGHLVLVGGMVVLRRSIAL